MFFKRFHVFSRVFTCVFSRRAFPNAPAWRAKPSSLRRSARTLTMLTSPRMYSRANLSWTSVYVRAHATRRARSQLCGAIRPSQLTPHGRRGPERSGPLSSLDQGPRRRAQTGIQCAHRPDG